MRLDSTTCRERLRAARSAYLATTGSDLAPHIVPVTFALLGDHIVTGVDQKPKTTTALRRLRNIAQNPRVAVLCDHYSDDWDRLWWVRADGTADVVDDEPTRRTAVAALADRYPHYAADPPLGPLIRIRVTGWTGWAHSG
ncbi:TIGR03668 family PPOX class F420-dependent oxidoreductase [Myceligenerans indicum]|uniref:TIGR03668 family PPOX class F420-dependent oxidoreductase n=1 Tax=Myceligenerans indicum TaxID=2593663 RepID=A0ABS1LJ29_9MICO|nr:TIGR03668 family PPOX class F420-dependent oxidoreductase [Myceligenerans indicum]MBL0886245.1 TIGR03668 family PPOX class F420-dependent oxidoreductase [Myceligenerans indicum]